jgi:hypothetical protein
MRKVNVTNPVKVQFHHATLEGSWQYKPKSKAPSIDTSFDSKGVNKGFIFSFL